MRLAFKQKAACINNNVSAYVVLAAVEYLAKLGIKITNLWSGLSDLKLKFFGTLSKSVFMLTTYNFHTRMKFRRIICYW